MTEEGMEPKYLDHRKAIDSMDVLIKGSPDIGIRCSSDVFELSYHMEHVTENDARRIRNYMEKATGQNSHTKMFGTRKTGYLLGIDCGEMQVRFSRRAKTALKKNKSVPNRYFNNNQMVVNATVNCIDDHPERIGYAYGIVWLLQSKNDILPHTALYRFCKSVVRNELGDITIRDIGGLDKHYDDLKSSVEMPLINPAVSNYFGFEKPTGVLLVGPPGNGKSMLMTALANDTNVNVLLLDPNEIASHYHTETETNVHKFFREAQRMAKDTRRPVIVACDEAERLLYDRSTTNEWDLLVTNTMLREMSSIRKQKDVIFLGATNTPWEIDPACYREGRIEKVIYIPAPNKETRKAILQMQTKNMPLKGVDIDALAERTKNWSGADLKSLCKKAAKLAVSHVAGNVDNYRKLTVKELKKAGAGVTQKDFDEALPTIKVNTRQQLEWSKTYDNWKGRWSEPPEGMFR